ncbi:MAG: patatin-like phospholipase family protein [Chloroflexi bacterium]|nr:patatin-like phospholipase family protein [Chloroflexota bacterium]
MSRPKIGLVLGGGGSRGLAHIGVLEVLAREQIPVDLIVGTSMGGIVGVLFALGYTPAQIADELCVFQGNSFIDSLKLISSRGRQQKARDHLSASLEGKTFSNLSVPVTLMAVDMAHGQEVTLTEGPLLPAVLASSAVPGAFPPVTHAGRQLADGGVIDSLATHVAYDQGADKIIAVDVYPPLEKDNPWTDPLSAIMGFQLPPNIFSTVGDGVDRIPTAAASMWRSVRVMTWYLHQQRLATHPPHVLLRPEVSSYGSLDFKDVDGPRQAGVVEAERCLAELRALVGWEEEKK